MGCSASSERAPGIMISRVTSIDDAYGETKNQIEDDMNWFLRARNASHHERAGMIASLEKAYRWEVGVQDGLAAAPPILFAIPGTIAAEIRSEFLRFRIFYKLAFIQGYSLTLKSKPALDGIASGHHSFKEAMVMAGANRALMTGIKALPTGVWKASAKYLGRGVISKAGKTGFSMLGLVPVFGALISGTMAASNISSFFRQSIANLPWFDVFLSHNWGAGEKNHIRMQKLKQELSQRGVRVWFDDDELKGNIEESIEKGILGSQLFLMMVTKEYLEKIHKSRGMDNCSLEAHIAIEANSPSSFLIVLLEEVDFVLPSYLQVLCQEKYVTCYRNSTREIDGIVTEIQHRLL